MNKRIVLGGLPIVIATLALILLRLNLHSRIPSSVAQGNTYYVAANGNDDDMGSEANPWRTIQKAADSLMPGDTVYVRGGIYSEAVTLNVSGSETEGYISFRNYPGEIPILDGSALTVPDADTGMFLIINQNHLMIEGFEIRNYSTSVQNRVPVGINIKGAAHHIQLRNNRIHHIATNALPTGPNLLGADAHGIAIFGTEAPQSLHHITVDGNELYDLKLGSSEALVLNGNVETFTITNNIIRDSDNIALDFIGFEEVAPDPAFDQARDGIVMNNTIYNIDSLNNPSYGGYQGADGIYVDGGTNIIIDANVVYSTNIEG